MDEQRKEPSAEWRRPARRPANVLTEEQKKHINRKMPPGWHALPDKHVWRLTPELLQAMTGAHITSCRRWLRTPPPAIVVRLVRILMAGDVGALHPAWRGWTVCHDGLLASPEEWYFKPGEVLAGKLALIWDPGWSTRQRPIVESVTSGEQPENKGHDHEQPGLQQVAAPSVGVPERSTEHPFQTYRREQYARRQR